MATAPTHHPPLTTIDIQRVRTRAKKARWLLGSKSRVLNSLTSSQMLEENAMFIQTIYEKQNEGKLEECTQ